MSADVLRQAAADLRAKAKRADDLDRNPSYGDVTGGPDAHWTPSFLAEAILDHPHVLDDDPRVRETVEAGADLLASWHPAVALAVADWLDEQADISVTYGHPMADGTPVIIHGPDPHAFAVARAYLGESA